MSIVARFFPNGEFSHGVDTSRHRKKRNHTERRFTPPTKRSIAERVQQYADINATIPIEQIEKPGQQYINRRGEVLTVVESGTFGVRLQWQCIDGKSRQYVTTSKLYDWLAAKSIKPLVHQLLESSENDSPPPSRKKLPTMTKNMGRNIRNAMYLLEHQPGGKDVLSFLTLTLPGLTPDGLAACCINWDKMVSRFLDWLKKRLKRLGIIPQYVYCTEIQPGRLQSRGEYAPHLHLVFRGRNGKKQPWAITPKDARRAWANCIRCHVSECFVDTALENLQRIKYSAARYLSKYMSKGSGQAPDEKREALVARLHTQWGGMSRNLSRRVKQGIQLVRGSTQWDGFAPSFLEAMPHLLEMKLVAYYKMGLIPIGHPEHPDDQRYLKVGSGCLARPLNEGGLVAVVQALEF